MVVLAGGRVRLAAVELSGSPRHAPHMIQRKDLIVFSITGAAVAAAAVVTFAGTNAVLKFAFAAVALSLLAMNVSSGTEQVGEHLSPGATGVMQAALGN